MILTEEQIQQIEIIKFSIKNQEDRTLTDKDALTIALEFTAAVLQNKHCMFNQVTVPLAGTKNVLN